MTWKGYHDGCPMHGSAQAPRDQQTDIGCMCEAMHKAGRCADGRETQDLIQDWECANADLRAGRDHTHTGKRVYLDLNYDDVVTCHTVEGYSSDSVHSNDVTNTTTTTGRYWPNPVDFEHAVERAEKWVGRYSVKAGETYTVEKNCGWGTPDHTVTEIQYREGKLKTRDERGDVYTWTVAVFEDAIEQAKKTKRNWGRRLDDITHPIIRLDRQYRIMGRSMNEPIDVSVHHIKSWNNSAQTGCTISWQEIHSKHRRPEPWTKEDFLAAIKRAEKYDAKCPQFKVGEVVWAMNADWTCPNQVTIKELLHNSVQCTYNPRSMPGATTYTWGKSQLRDDMKRAERYFKNELSVGRVHTIQHENWSKPYEVRITHSSAAPDLSLGYVLMDTRVMGANQRPMSRREFIAAMVRADKYEAPVDPYAAGTTHEIQAKRWPTPSIVTISGTQTEKAINHGFYYGCSDTVTFRNSQGHPVEWTREDFIQGVERAKEYKNPYPVGMVVDIMHGTWDVPEARCVVSSESDCIGVQSVHRPGPTYHYTPKEFAEGIRLAKQHPTKYKPGDLVKVRLFKNDIIREVCLRFIGPTGVDMRCEESGQTHSLDRGEFDRAVERAKAPEKVEFTYTYNIRPRFTKE